MGRIYNFYCDESCHLENDRKRAMVLGALMCPMHNAKDLNKQISDIKLAHGLRRETEIKWKNVSASKINFYIDLVDFFFSKPQLSFRALVADKTNLDHEQYDQTHDDWYFKMYFVLLKHVIKKVNRYNVYLDVKDTRSSIKIRKLHDVLCSNFKDFECDSIKRIHTVASVDVSLVQLCDLLIGCLSSNANEPGSANEGKVQLRRYLEKRSGYSLGENTGFGAHKVNWLVWPNGRL